MSGTSCGRRPGHADRAVEVAALCHGGPQAGGRRDAVDAVVALLRQFLGVPDARGQDIYAVTAPLVVEAVHRILGGQTRTIGVASAGEIFDAAGFLGALSSHLSVELLR